MDLRLATLKAVSFYLLHNVSTLINAESFPVSQLCVNTLPATNITLLTNGTKFGSLRVKARRTRRHQLHRPFYIGFMTLYLPVVTQST
jgi:hypothetical protein